MAKATTRFVGCCAVIHQVSAHLHLHPPFLLMCVHPHLPNPLGLHLVLVPHSLPYPTTDFAAPPPLPTHTHAHHPVPPQTLAASRDGHTILEGPEGKGLVPALVELTGSPAVDFDCLATVADTLARE